MVSVIVPFFGDPGNLMSGLAALQSQVAWSAGDEVIVVDNHLEPILQEADLRSRWPNLNIKVFHEPKPGSYAARNFGVKMAAGSILAFTDSDCRPDPCWVKNGTAEILAGGQVLAGAVDVRKSNGAEANYFEKYQMLADLRQRHYVQDLKFAATANLWVTREAFEVVGCFDDSFFSSGDFDWGVRCNQSGFVIQYRDNIRVEHEPRATLAGLIKKSRRLGGGHYLLDKKWGRTVRGGVSTNRLRLGPYLLLHGFLMMVRRIEKWRCGLGGESQRA